MSDQDTNVLPGKWPEFESPERLQQIVEIIAEDGAIDADLIKPEATLETLGLESVDVVMILMGIEEKLDTYLPMNNDLASARNMAEFVAAIDRIITDAESTESGKDAN